MSADHLTPEEIAELDRRATDALKHPHRGRPAQEIFNDIEEQLAPELLAEFERRGEELVRMPSSGIPWEKVRENVRRKLKGR